MKKELKHQHRTDIAGRSTAQLDSANEQISGESDGGRRVENALVVSEDRFRKIFDFANMIIWGADASGKVQYFNNEAERVLGYSRAEALTMQVTDFHPAEDHEAIIKGLAVQKSGMLSREMEVGLCAKGGERRQGSLSQITIRDITGQLFYFATVLDITERKAVEAELSRYRCRLEELVEERTAELTRANAQLQEEIARRKQATEEAAVMEERGRLARELHDSVTQSLYSVTLFAETSKKLAASGDLVRAQECLNELGESVQGVLKELRLLIYDLRPSTLEEEGLIGALRQRLDAVERRSGVKGDLVVAGEESIQELPAAIEESLYRIAQEALNNALKHAAASLVSVRIAANAESVELAVSDNGVGFDARGLRNGGIGMMSMRERTERLGGHFQVLSAPGAGTTIRVALTRRENG